MQLGVKSAKVFGINNTFGFTEINLAKPYMYTHRNSQRSYSHFNDALAHPLGANFIESVTRLEQQYKNFRTFIQINYARYGADSAIGNVGNNILLSYNTRNSEYGNKILQGVNSSLLYVDARLAYVINPKVNFCIELGYVYRNQQNAGQVNSANQITLALKTGFRNLYWDR
jgi:maltoporin